MEFLIPGLIGTGGVVVGYLIRRYTRPGASPTHQLLRVDQDTRTAAWSVGWVGTMQWPLAPDVIIQFRLFQSFKSTVPSLRGLGIRLHVAAAAPDQFEVELKVREEATDGPSIAEWTVSGSRIDGTVQVDALHRFDPPIPLDVGKTYVIDWRSDSPWVDWYASDMPYPRGDAMQENGDVLSDMTFMFTTYG